MVVHHHWCQFALWFHWLCGSIGCVGQLAMLVHLLRTRQNATASKCSSCMVWYFIVSSSNGLPSNSKALLNFLPPANEVCEGYVFTCVCHSVHRGDCLVPGWGAGPSGVPGPRGCLVLGGSGSSMPCRFLGPHPRGKLRGIWSRPTPKGEVEGDLVQAHTQGGSWGDLVQAHTQAHTTMTATAAGGMHPTGMHSC